MANSEEEISGIANDEHGMEALWSIVRSVEQKDDTFTLEIRQLLLQPNQEVPMNYGTIGSRERDVARSQSVNT